MCSIHLHCEPWSARPCNRKLSFCRFEPQQLPRLLEEEAEDLVQKIGDAWGRIATIPPGAVLFAHLTLALSRQHLTGTWVVAAVAKVVATAQPPVEFMCNKYREAHSAVVGSAAYNRALDIADGVVKRVQASESDHSIDSIACTFSCRENVLCTMQDTYVYQVAASRLYPVVSPIADQALDKLTHSPVYTAVKDHLTPPIGDGSVSPAMPALCAQC